MRIFSVIPFTAFSRLIDREYSKSEPLLDLLDPEKGSPPPNKSPKISPNISLKASVAEREDPKPDELTP